MPSNQYRDSHVKDKTVGVNIGSGNGLLPDGTKPFPEQMLSPTVLSLTWESPYLGKTVFILRRGPGALFTLQ